VDPETEYTLGQLWEQAAELLEDAGIAAPRREALRLYRVLTGPEAVTAPLPDRETVVSFEAGRDYLGAVEDFSIGMPLAYLAGWAGFRHLTLACDRRALVPRPETEGLVELALLRVREGVAVDVGTGTGAIALSLASEGSFARVFGTDLSPDALALARRNGRRTGIKVTWLVGDLLAPLGGRKVNLLVSNPPYLSTLEYDALEPGVREWEPATALIGGSDGLEFYRRLLAEAPAVLEPGGWIALEVDARRPQETAALATAHGWIDVRIFDDLFGRARYLLARRETLP
jgi:release factor glutamine methyltransferase